MFSNFNSPPILRLLKEVLCKRFTSWRPTPNLPPSSRPLRHDLYNFLYRTSEIWLLCFYPISFVELVYEWLEPEFFFSPPFTWLTINFDDRPDLGRVMEWHRQLSSLFWETSFYYDWSQRCKKICVSGHIIFNVRCPYCTFILTFSSSFYLLSSSGYSLSLQL